VYLYMPLKCHQRGRQFVLRRTHGLVHFFCESLLESILGVFAWINGSRQAIRLGHEQGCLVEWRSAAQ